MYVIIYISIYYDLSASGQIWIWMQNYIICHLKPVKLVIIYNMKSFCKTKSRTQNVLLAFWVICLCIHGYKVKSFGWWGMYLIQTQWIVCNMWVWSYRSWSVESWYKFHLIIVYMCLESCKLWATIEIYVWIIIYHKPIILWHVMQHFLYFFMCVHTY